MTVSNFLQNLNFSFISALQNFFSLTVKKTMNNNKSQKKKKKKNVGIAQNKEVEHLFREKQTFSQNSQSLLTHET